MAKHDDGSGTKAIRAGSAIEILTSEESENLPCVRFFSIGQVTKVGMRNGCAECKIAVINFVYPNGTQPPRSEIKRFRIAGYSEQEVDISGTLTTEIIGEDPCT